VSGAHSRRVLRELKSIMEPNGFVLDGRTGTSHYRWRHEKSGRIMTTVSSFGDPRSLKNTIRDVKRKLREIEHAHQ
jgi:predicted RNA binding protein YcfA (HicA-like mRNA interferase family)